MKNNQPDVKELLKALQLTIEFEGQLSKRYEKHVSAWLFIIVFFKKKTNASHLVQRSRETRTSF